jgi:diacylglycerol kinase family enzyme
VRVALIVNAGAGDGSDGRRETAERVLREAGLDVTVLNVRPREFTSAAQRASREYDAVVAAGGDGTVSSIAAGLVGSEAALGVLPMGTLNHFAKDLGLPLEPEEAAKVVAAGHVRTVDVGEVNGRVFVNNSSIGAYAVAVTMRERLEEQHGYGKWVAMARAAISVFARLPVLTVHLQVDGEPVHVRTPLVLVGNNVYEVASIPPGGRPSLDDGCLSLYTVRAVGRLHLMRLALRGLLGRLHAADEFEFRRAGELEIAVARSSLRVAIDGEVVRMRPPLSYRSRRGGLRVLAPPED